MEYLGDRGRQAGSVALEGSLGWVTGVFSEVFGGRQAANKEFGATGGDRLRISVF